MATPKSVEELAKTLKSLGMSGFEAVQLQAGGQVVHGLSGGVEESRRFGFIPPGQRRELQAVTVLVPKDQKQASFPRSAISIQDRHGEWIGAEAGWSVVADEEVEGNWVLNLRTG